MIAIGAALVLALALYFGLGLVFALLFAWRGAAAIDPAAEGATWGFRVLIVPASALLWPLLLRRWWRRQPPPSERNAHREAAAADPTAARASSRPTAPGGGR